MSGPEATMISRFFIDRPIFAAVLSIFITLTGGIALLSLPIAQYPPITPPGVAVSIFYPGASAQVVADTVAAPIEQQVNGVEGMLYMSSQMGNDGSYMLTVTFDIGTDLNTALVMVQNRVQLAMPLLPTSVQNQGITIRKKTPDILNIISFYSPDGRYDDVYLSNYATIHVLDELLRIDGVSQINYQGVGNYSIRVWLDPQKLASLNMTVLDVANAIRNQNLDAPAGMLGQQPSTRTQPFELPIDTLGRLTTTEQFGDLIVKADQGQPPPSPSAPLTASTGPHGLPTLGTTGPLDTGAHSSASGVTMATGDTTPGTGKTFESGTTIGLTSSATTGMTGMGTSSGGGTTGGAQSIGGATTGGGATATVMGGGSTSLGSGASIPGTTPGVAGSGVLSATTMGRGPG
ncbi:MAG: efflux RND transporter permease subunit, partial [Isosphaeraceae bacterium]